MGVPPPSLNIRKVAQVLLEFGADSSAKDCSGDFPDHVIGTGAPADVDDACARELSEIVIGHRTRVKGRDGDYGVVVSSHMSHDGAIGLS